MLAPVGFVGAATTVTLTVDVDVLRQVVTVLLQKNEIEPDTVVPAIAV